jgi:hypothetical protein
LPAAFFRVTIAAQLQTHLDQLAPGWEWTCELQPRSGPAAGLPQPIRVQGKNRNTHEETLSIYVTETTGRGEKLQQTARFVLQILMIDVDANQKKGFVIRA